MEFIWNTLNDAQGLVSFLLEFIFSRVSSILLPTVSLRASLMAAIIQKGVSTMYLALTLSQI